MSNNYLGYVTGNGQGRVINKTAALALATSHNSKGSLWWLKPGRQLSNTQPLPPPRPASGMRERMRRTNGRKLTG